MKNKILAALLITFCTSSFAQQIPEKYARDLDKITQQYSQDMRDFLKSLPPTTVQFDSQQKNKYCSIVATYVGDFYQLTNKNRDSLPFYYANMTKQDVINKVKQSKEMQILKDYNIQCDLNQN